MKQNLELLHKNSSPMLVSSLQKRDADVRWSKFDALSEDVKDKLASQETVRLVQDIAKKYKISIEEIAHISRMIRGYYFREIQKENFDKYLRQYIPRLQESQSKDISHIINIKILQQVAIKKEDRENIRLSLNKAIETYPQILKQTITDRQIVTKPFLNPLKPTVKNWIMVYEKILDVSSHTMIERGDFVFRSEATGGLSEDERRVLLMLFKSRDEGSKLIIDPNEGKIIFVQQQKKQEKKQEKKIPKQQIVQDLAVPVNKTRTQNSQNNTALRPTHIQKVKKNVENNSKFTNSHFSTGNKFVQSGVESIQETKNKSQKDQPTIEYIPREVQSKNSQLRKFTDGRQLQGVARNIVTDEEQRSGTLSQNEYDQNISKNAKVASVKSEKEDTSLKAKHEMQKQKSLVTMSNEIGAFQHTMQDRSQIHQVSRKKNTVNLARVSASPDPVHKIELQKPKTDNTVLTPDLQEEIAKNRVEMKKEDDSLFINTAKKIGTQTYDDAKKINDEKHTRAPIGTPLSVVKKPLPTKEQINKNQKSFKKKQSPPTQKQPNISGEISFSSNHIMPAEKTKRVSQKNTQNTFNMKPIGRSHKV